MERPRRRALLVLPWLVAAQCRAGTAAPRASLARVSAARAPGRVLGSVRAPAMGPALGLELPTPAPGLVLPTPGPALQARESVGPETAAPPVHARETPPSGDFDRELVFPLTFQRDDGTAMTVEAYRIQHRLAPGWAKGGIRWHPAVDARSVGRLAEEMSAKTAVLDLPMGGSKGGVRVDPGRLSAAEQARLMRAYAAALAERGVSWENDAPAPDVGTNAAHMAVYMDEALRRWLGRDAAARARYPGLAALALEEAAPEKTPVLDAFLELVRSGGLEPPHLRLLASVTGKPVDKGGIAGRAEATGRGVVLAARAAARNLWGVNLEGLSVAVQGFGNVGSWAARLFVQEGARVTAVSDASGVLVDPSGLDVAALSEHYREHRTLRGFSAGRFSADREGVSAVPVDIFVPAAMENTLTAAVARTLPARLVVEGANLPTTPEADRILGERGIPVVPDILANANGVLVSYLEQLQALGAAEAGRWEPWSLEAVRTRSGEIFSRRIRAVFEEAARLGSSWREAARAIARRRVERPAVSGRLSRDVAPSRYDLSLSLDPAHAAFSGRARIAVSAGKPTRTLTLHALELDIRQALVNGRRLDPSRIAVDEKAETVTLTLDEPISGPAVVELAYSGRMSSQMRGLYQSRARVSGREELYAFTHLEPTHARRLVPGFDEPDFKAVFGLTLTGPRELTLLSNMPAQARSVSGALQTVVFQDSPRMSTYLLAVAAARLVPTGRKVGRTQITVWTGPGQQGQAGFALDAAEHALKTLNAYFDLPYRLPKLDLVAVPDFSSGAMENWGAIFFRDSALLIDPQLSSLAARRRVAEVVSHEIVHQWFGNLVTMSWWNDLWLNEAFATWLAAKVLDRARPEWKVWLDFEKGKRAPLHLDSLRQTRAVSARAASPAEIQALFDPLTYQKGGAILRMLESFLGERAFRRGLRGYMRRFQYGNAEAKDLWAELETASGRPVARLAEAWLSQPGYPLVTVRAVSPDRRTLELSQKRFSAHNEESAARWAVPIVLRYRLAGERRLRSHRVVLEEASAVVRLPGRGKLAWATPTPARRASTGSPWKTAWTGWR